MNNINPNFKHGCASGKRTAEYRVWKGIKQRCYNANNPAYDRYGGRGIQMSVEWKDSFITFLGDIGNRPSGNHSIDRIDVNGNYEKENCRWSTSSEQARNRRIKNEYGVPGVRFDKSRTLKPWVAAIKVNRRNKHLGSFETIEEAIEARRQGELTYYTSECAQ